LLTKGRAGDGFTVAWIHFWLPANGSAGDCGNERRGATSAIQPEGDVIRPYFLILDGLRRPGSAATCVGGAGCTMYEAGMFRPVSETGYRIRIPTGTWKSECSNG